VGRREHPAEDGVPLAPVLLHSADRVAAEGLHDHVGRPGRRAHLRPLLLGEGLENSHREAVVRLARDLGRAQDGGAVGRVDRPAVAGRGHVRRGLADAAGVEELVLVLDIEGEDLAALEEERPFLLVEGLVGGQVEDRGVGLDLAEVGVDGRVEGEVRREPDLRVEPEGAGEVGALPGDGRPRARLSDHVGQELDVPGRRQVADPVQLAELVHPPGVLAGDELPLALLLVAGQPAPRVHAPDLLLLAAEPQLVEGHPELGRPPLLVVGHLAVPDRVPGGVPLHLAVAEDEVDLAPTRGEVELEAGPLVVVAVEADPDDVAREVAEVVAAARVAVHPVRLVVGADGEVEVLVVVEDLELGGLRRGGTLGGQLLRVVARPLPLPLPRLVVEPAVDHRGLQEQAGGGVEARRVLPAEGVGRVGRLRLLGRREGRDGRGQERDAERPGEGAAAWERDPRNRHMVRLPTTPGRGQ